MLYERWAGIAAARRNELALRDTASGRHWTFGELFQAGESMEMKSQSGFVHPQGTGVEFILTLLGGWREGKPILPLETGQSAPQLPTVPDWCVHLKLTSATTGTSRGVAFTEQQLAADAENIVATMGLRPDWLNLGMISLAHSYGFSNLVLPMLLHGIPLILAPSPLPEMLKRAAEGGTELTLAAVPALWSAWHEVRAIPSNVRLAISAGSPLPLELEHAVHAENGLKLHNFYGSSECGGIAYDRSTLPRNDESLAGTPMNGVNLTVNETGCLIVNGDAVAESYWPVVGGNPGERRFETSDLVDMKDGMVFFRGRASDVINMAGRKVSPHTIERALASHPKLRACLVFGVPAQDATRTDDIVACVVADGTVTGESLRTFLSNKLPAWQLPREWWFINSLAPNRLGKLSRADWRRKYLERIGTEKHIQT